MLNWPEHITLASWSVPAEAPPPPPPQPLARFSWMVQDAARFNAGFRNVEFSTQMAQFATQVYEECMSNMAHGRPPPKALPDWQTQKPRIINWLLEHFEMSSRAIVGQKLEDEALIPRAASAAHLGAKRRKVRHPPEIKGLDESAPQVRSLSLAACTFVGIMAIECQAFVAQQQGGVAALLLQNGDDLSGQIQALEQECRDATLRPFLTTPGSTKPFSLLLGCKKMTRLFCQHAFVSPPSSKEAEMQTFTEHACRLWCALKSGHQWVQDRGTSFQAEKASLTQLDAFLDEYMSLRPDEKELRKYLEFAYQHLLVLGARERYLQLRGSLGDILVAERSKDEIRSRSMLMESFVPEDFKSIQKDLAGDLWTMYYSEALQPPQPVHKYEPLLHLFLFLEYSETETQTQMSRYYYTSPQNWWCRLSSILLYQPQQPAEAAWPQIVPVFDQVVVKSGADKIFVPTLKDAIVLFCGLVQVRHQGRLHTGADLSRICAKVVSPADLQIIQQTWSRAPPRRQAVAAPSVSSSVARSRS